MAEEQKGSWRETINSLLTWMLGVLWGGVVMYVWSLPNNAPTSVTAPCPTSPSPESTSAPIEKEKINLALLANWKKIPLPPAPEWGYVYFTGNAPSFSWDDRVLDDGILLRDTIADTALRDYTFKIINGGFGLEKLQNMIAAGSVEILFGNLPTNVGAEVRKNDNGSWRLIIDFDTFRILDFGSIQQFASNLHHETEHILYSFSDEGKKDGIESVTPEEFQKMSSDDYCRRRWNSEFGATLAEARGSVLSGQRTVYSIRINDISAMKQKFFMLQFDATGKAISYFITTPQCINVWAKMAGHPTPEKFIQ